MEHNAIKYFIKKRVKLTYNNGFNLKGEVVEIFSDSILFKTKKCESVIPLSDIK